MPVTRRRVVLVRCTTLGAGPVLRVAARFPGGAAAHVSPPTANSPWPARECPLPGSTGQRPQARRVGGVPGSFARRTLASRARTQPTKAVETPPRDSNLQGARDATISPSSYVRR